MKLTPEQEVQVGDDLGDVLHFEGDDIAVSLGIPSRDERDWTNDEIERVWAEIERRWRPFFTECIVDSERN